MSFLVAASQKSLFILQRSQLNYEYNILMSRTNVITSQMADMANSMSDKDLDENPTYIAMEKTSEYLETQAESIKDQMSVLDTEISNLQKNITDGIKNTCTLNLIGG